MGHPAKRFVVRRLALRTSEAGNKRWFCYMGRGRWVCGRWSGRRVPVGAGPGASCGSCSAGVVGGGPTRWAAFRGRGRPRHTRLDHVAPTGAGRSPALLSGRGTSTGPRQWAAGHVGFGGASLAVAVEGEGEGGAESWAKLMGWPEFRTIYGASWRSVSVSPVSSLSSRRPTLLWRSRARS